MAHLMDIVKKGSTDRSVALRIVDSGDGTPETGVVYNTSGIDLWYRREGAAKTSITEASLSALTDAHSDGGFLHVGDGEYRLDLPDAAFASGSNYVDIGGTVTGMIVIGGRVRLVNYDLEDGVRLGLTALPNAAAEASGGLYTRGTGAGQINQDANGRIDVNAAAVSGDATAADNLETMLDGTGGNTLTLKQLNIDNSNGSAILAVSSGGNGSGIQATGNGTGRGIYATGGATGNGITAEGGFSGGDGILSAAISGNGFGFRATASGTGSGIQATGGATGSGMKLIGGSTSGDGLLAVAGTGGGYDINADIQGSLSGTVGGIVGTLQTLDSLWSKIKKFFQLALRKDSAIATDNATELSELNANEGSGAGAFANTTDSGEAIRDRGDAAWVTGTALDAAGVRAAVGLASANLDTQLSAIEAQTDDIGTAGAGLTAIPWNAAWDAEVQSEVDDALDSVIADSVAADGSRPSIRQALLMMTRFLFERSVVSTTLTVKKEDGSTSSMTFTLNDATSPTSLTRAS